MGVYDKCRVLAIVIRIFFDWLQRTTIQTSGLRSCDGGNQNNELKKKKNIDGLKRSSL